MTQIQRIFKIILFLPLFAIGQTEEVLPFVQRHVPAQAMLKVSAVGDTIEMPVNEDFSRKSPLPHPTFWTDNNVFVNSTIATNLYSLGAATFDGTDQYGFPYDINYNGSDSMADVLTSRYFKFPVPPNNVFLSFYYQMGGLGDVPEPEDSLVVEYFVPQDTAWERVWSVGGTMTSTKFKAAIIPVPNNFLVEGFRFRIASYGALNGAFDVWNVDYIKLDANRNPNDTLISEPAFVKNHPYLTKPFTHIPWFHFADAQISDSLTFTYRRNGPPPSGGWALNLGKFDLQKNGTTVKDRLNVPVVTNLVHDVDVDFKVPLQPVTTTAPTDEFELEMRTWFDGTAEGFRSNDTVQIKIPFKNYYAYDDGSAEHGYGIKNKANARLAFQFNPITPDSLQGLFINFAHVGVDATTNTFRIAIWEDDNGEPGLIKYLSDSLYSPEYAYYHDGFMPFELKNKVFIPGSVFIGFMQTTSDAIHVGIDFNTTDATVKYYGSGFTWDESLVPGTLLIRPYFNYTPRDFSVNEQHLKSPVVYPNPANNVLIIATENDELVSWTLINNIGKQVISGNGNQIDVAHLPRGLYILQTKIDQTLHNHKIILQ